MNNPILNILKCNKEIYENEVFNLWFQWCEIKTNNIKTLQKALVLKPLFNWWEKELEKIERDFIKEAEDYGDSLTHQVALEYWKQSVSKIHNRFSKVLLNQV